MKGVAIRSRLERGSAVRWIAWQCLTDEPRDTSFRYPLLQRDYPWNVCTCCLSSYSHRFQSALTLCCTIYNKSWCSSSWGISAALLILIWSTRFHYASRPMNQWIRKTHACIISGRPARLPSAELVQTWQNPRRSPGFWQTSSVSASVKLVISSEAKVWKAWQVSSINSALTCGVGTLSAHQWRSYARRIAVMKFSRMWMKMNEQMLTTSQQQQQTISTNVTSMLDLSICLTIWWAISCSYDSIFKKLGNNQLVHPHLSRLARRFSLEASTSNSSLPPKDGAALRPFEETCRGFWYTANTDTEIIFPKYVTQVQWRYCTS